VIGVADALKGEVPVGLVVLKAGHDRDADEITKELSGGPQHHRPVAAFKRS
jgi:propionyl-CoA synthetase